MTCFEDLSTDLLLEIFNYLSFTDLIQAFSNLQKHFDDAIRDYPACVNLLKISNQKSSFQYRSLKLSGLDVDIFQMKYSQLNLTSLRSITLIKMNLHTLNSLIEKLPIQQLQSITIGRLTWHYYPIDFYKQVWDIIMNTIDGSRLRYLYLPYHIRHCNIQNLSNDFTALRYATLEYISATQMLRLMSHAPNLRRFKACVAAPHKDLFRYNVVLSKLFHLTLILQDEWSFEEIQQLFILCPYLKYLILKLEIREETKNLFEPIAWQTLIEEKLTHLIYLRFRLNCIITHSNIKNNNFQENFNHNEYWTQRQPQFQVTIKQIQQNKLL